MEISSVIPSVIKNIITEGYTDEMERINLFFLLPTDLPMEKKLLTKDSPTENFRR